VCRGPEIRAITGEHVHQGINSHQIHLAGSTEIETLLIGTRGGVIAGEVRLDNSSPPIANADVVLLREGREPRWTRADGAGKFTFDSLAPGEYQAFVWEEVERGEYLDSDYVRRQRG
jgi:hypothetical protein